MSLGDRASRGRHEDMGCLRRSGCLKRRRCFCHDRICRPDWGDTGAVSEPEISGSCCSPNGLAKSAEPYRHEKMLGRRRRRDKLVREEKVKRTVLSSIHHQN